MAAEFFFKFAVGISNIIYQRKEQANIGFDLFFQVRGS
jgi:hypothetical protein